MNKGTDNRDTEAGEPVWEGGRNLAGTKLWEGKSEQHGLMVCLFKTEKLSQVRGRREPLEAADFTDLYRSARFQLAKTIPD